ncbi:MAG: nucleoside triphosphate pyrophosphohydrolase, partial [Clostridiales bacterium]|nr:nucleoside triphosphate pyrophosphohydrolase [Clostridiales bacterium]
MSYKFEKLLNITSILRGENGCPWDKKQNPDSMRKYIIEEAYETTQAIEDNDEAELCEELGDLLFQVVFQAQMAKERGAFDIDDVIEGISKKMVMRHPHIFGGEGAEDFAGLAGENNKAFLGKWEDKKKEEKGYRTQTEVLRAIPPSLPALMRADKVLFKAENAGLDLGEVDESFVRPAALADEVAALESAEGDDYEVKIGDIILKLSNISRKLQLNTEFSLTKATEKFINKFEYIE